MERHERDRVRDGLVETIGTATESLNHIAHEMTPAELALAYDALNQTAKDVALLADLFKQLFVEEMRKAGLAKATVQGVDGSPYTVEVVNRAVRKNVRRDDLVVDVEKLANDSTFRLDPVTGEVVSVEEARIRLLKSAFRFEPRWTEIGKLGLNDDEYCERDWSSSISIEKAVTL